jgi:hypothetical protein
MATSAWRVDGITFKRSEFFARLCLSAFRELSYVIDDDALLSSATRYVLCHTSPPHRAFTHATALKQLHEGAVFVNDRADLMESYPHLAWIEKDMRAQGRVNKEAALLLTLQWLRGRAELPTVLHDAEEVVFESVFDFSECELQILLRLAELSQPLRFVLPLDAKPRGLLLPIQDLLTQLEAHSVNLPITLETHEIQVAEPLQPFWDAIFDPLFLRGNKTPVRIALPSHFASQIDWVCEHILALQRSSPQSSIAIAFRSIDVRTRWFEEGLRSLHVPYKIGASLPLSELPEAKAIFRQLKTKLEETHEKTFAAHLRELLDSPGVRDLSPLLQFFAHQLEDESSVLTTQSFYHWLRSLLERREAGFSADHRADAVDIVSVKQLWTKKFDYVFLVDLSQGRFPKTIREGDAFTDAERFDINQRVGKRVFPFVMDDPLEGSVLPARQAMESLWFVGALASAQQGLFLCSSLTDPKGREQAPSEFLNAAMRIVPCDTSINPSKRLFQSGNQTLLSSSFQVDPEQSKKVFARWLGLQAAHPLTPTRLEAFAQCPFRTLVQRIFSVDDPNSTTDDVDPRATGRFAHAVLETFFKNYTSQWGDVQGLSPAGRAFLKDIIVNKKDLLNFEGSKVSAAILKAQMLWLSLVIERAISNMLKTPPVSGVNPKHFEYSVGFGDPSFPISIGSEEVFLGGIIDRVDEGPDGVAVFDYKMSTAPTLRQKGSEKEFLQTHFQLPLYARLVLSANPELRDKNIYASLLSIRDGAATPVLGADIVRDLKDRVLDDDREDGLVAAIRRVMTPVLDGHFEAKENASCTSCYLKAVCRI